MKKIGLAILIAALAVGGMVAASVYIIGGMSLVGSGTVGVAATYGQGSRSTGNYKVLRVSQATSAQLNVWGD